MRATRDCRIWRAKCYRCWRHRLSSWRRRLRRSRSKSIPTQLAKPGVSSGHRSRLNDEDSVRGPHQGQQSTRTAPTGRTHDCKRPLRCTPNDLLQGGGHPHMKRREFITLLGGAAAAWPIAAFAQQPDKTARVGWLAASLDNPVQALGREVLLSTLRKLGFTEGYNLVLEHRRTDEGMPKAFAGANELVAAKADVLIADGPEIALQAATAARPIVPVVMLANNYNPFERGYVRTLAQPGGNVTGLFYRQQELA